MSTDNVVQMRWKPRADLGDRLRLLRRSYGRMMGQGTITQVEMAQLLNEPEGTYKSWEAGNSRPSDLIAFAKKANKITGVDPAWLLDVAAVDDGPDGPEGTRDQGIALDRCRVHPIRQLVLVGSGAGDQIDEAA